MPCIYLGALAAPLFLPQRPRSALSFPQRGGNRRCRLCITRCQNPRKPVQNRWRAWVFALDPCPPQTSPVGGGYCRLQMWHLPPAGQWLGIGWAPWRGGGVPPPRHRLGALEGGGGVPPPLPMHPWGDGSKNRVSQGVGVAVLACRLWCIVLVCSRRRQLAARHSLPFPWPLSLHWRWCPSAWVGVGGGGGVCGGRPGQRVEEPGTWASRTWTRSAAGCGRPVDGVWTAKTVKQSPQQPAQPRYANYWAPLTHQRHIPPHPAQPRHTNDGAPRTRKRHQREHRPQRPTERSDPTQHAKGRAGDCPGPRKEKTTRPNVTQGGGISYPWTCPWQAVTVRTWMLWMTWPGHRPMDGTGKGAEWGGPRGGPAPRPTRIGQQCQHTREREETLARMRTVTLYKSARCPVPHGVIEGNGAQRQPQRRSGRRLEEVAKAVGGGHCRLQMPLKPALAVRGTVAGHRLGALEGGGRWNLW